MYYVQKHSGRKLTWLHHMSLGKWLGEGEREEEREGGEGRGRKEEREEGGEGERKRGREEEREDTYTIMSLACLLR